jgi:large subunit ribosomal protein L25
MKLTIQNRTEDAAAVRATGNIPAVFYGPKAASTPITVNGPEFMKVWRQAGESSVVTLTGLGEDHDALIHDISKHPVKDTVTHVDFYVIEKGKKVQVAVPLEFIGESAAVKTLGGVLIKVIHELEIEAMPKDLPHAIEVDISSLVDFDAQIKVFDIKLPSGVMAQIDADEVVALVSAPKEEVEEVTAPIDMASIGISEERGKKEEEEIPAE